MNFGQIRSKIKVSLNLCKNWHTSQFEDSEFEIYRILFIGFWNLNPNLGRCSSNIQTLWDMKIYLPVNLAFA